MSSVGHPESTRVPPEGQQGCEPLMRFLLCVVKEVVGQQQSDEEPVLVLNQPHHHPEPPSGLAEHSQYHILL